MAGRKSDFTLPTNTLDDLFSTQEERDDAKLSKIRDIPLELIKNCDLFICVDNGKLYCPGEKEMFEWRGEVGKADFDGKTKAKPSRNKDYRRCGDRDRQCP